MDDDWDNNETTTFSNVSYTTKIKFIHILMCILNFQDGVNTDTGRSFSKGRGFVAKQNSGMY